jgi:phytoene synthase
VRRELDAAGITDPTLRASYEQCRRLNAAHGKTYYLATLLLPAHKRPHVHALYGFARFADEIVDDLLSTSTGAERAARLADWGKRFLAGESDDAVLLAVHHTIATYDIPRQHFDDFLDSMAMDLTVDHYDTFDDLMGYMHGSAAVIGLEMLPVLGTLGPQEDAAPYAADLGVAFQLSNFLRDVGEDLRRGRVYLPTEDVERFGIDVEQLREGIVDASFRQLMAYEIARTREIYARAALGIPLLEPTSRDCIRAALLLYGGILDEIEKADYQVLGDRVVVPRRTRIAVALPRLAGALIARSHER